MYKLIAIDIDGTLINNQQEMEEETKKAIKYARDKGIMVIISTGRIMWEAKDFAQEAGMDKYAISCSGAGISNFETNEYMVNTPMDFETGIKVLKVLEKYGFAGFAYSGEHMIVSYGNNDKAKRLGTKRAEGFSKRRILVDKISDYVKEHNLCMEKIFAGTDYPEIIESTRRELEIFDDIHITSSGKDNIEILKTGLDKGKSLLQLGKMLNIDASEMIAIGDSDNDYEMLKVVGMPVAMKNANERIRGIAKYITDDNENAGVAKAIYHFIK